MPRQRPRWASAVHPPDNDYGMAYAARHSTFFRSFMDDYRAAFTSLADELVRAPSWDTAASHLRVVLLDMLERFEDWQANQTTPYSRQAFEAITGRFNQCLDNPPMRLTTWKLINPQHGADFETAVKVLRSVDAHQATLWEKMERGRPEHHEATASIAPADKRAHTGGAPAPKAWIRQAAHSVLAGVPGAGLLR